MSWKLFTQVLNFADFRMFCPLYSEARRVGEKRKDFSTKLGKSTQNISLIFPPPQNPNQYSSACMLFPKFSLGSQRFTISGQRSRRFHHKRAFCLSSYPLAGRCRHGYAPWQQTAPQSGCTSLNFRNSMQAELYWFGFCGGGSLLIAFAELR